MFNVSFVWDDKVMQGVQDTAWERLVFVIVAFRNKLREILGVANPTKYIAHRTRNTVAGKKGSQYTAYVHGAPRPGPPWKRTGWLQKHVNYELQKEISTGRVGIGVEAKYGLWLQLKGWDWFESTLKRELPSLQRIMTEGLP